QQANCCGTIYGHDGIPNLWHSGCCPCPDQDLPSLPYPLLAVLLAKSCHLCSCHARQATSEMTVSSRLPAGYGLLPSPRNSRRSCRRQSMGPTLTARKDLSPTTAFCHCQRNRKSARRHLGQSAQPC